MPAIGVGVGPAFGRRRRWPFPTQVDGGNLILWLRADQGVTLSSASVSNDTTEASNLWAKQANVTRADGQPDPVGGTSAIKLTDTAAAGAHGITRAATNLVAGPTLVDLWLAPGTITWAFAASVTGGTSRIYLDLVNGVSGSAFDGATARVIATGLGGWKLWRIEGVWASGSLAILLANANNGQGYTGDGTGTIFIGSGATYGPVLYQDRVSQWGDQSGLGNHATQGTAANQLLLQCRDGSGLWVPYGTAGSVCEIGWPSDVASKNVALPAAVYQAFNGDNAPVTVLELRRRMGALAGTVANGFWLTGATSQQLYTLGFDASQRLFSQWRDPAALIKSVQGTGATGTGWESAALVGTTTASQYRDGTVDPAGADVDVAPFTFTAGQFAARFKVTRELVVYKSALSDTDRKRVENGMRARWGLAPV